MVWKLFNLASILNPKPDSRIVIFQAILRFFLYDLSNSVYVFLTHLVHQIKAACQSSRASLFSFMCDFRSTEI